MLEEYTILSITIEVISEVTEVLEGVESTGIRVDWLDQAIGKIHRAREHHKLIQNVKTLGV